MRETFAAKTIDPVPLVADGAQPEPASSFSARSVHSAPEGVDFPPLSEFDERLPAFFVPSTQLRVLK